MSGSSFLWVLLSLQASGAFAAKVESVIAADGTIRSKTTDVQGLLSEVEDMVNSGAAPDDDKIKTIDELIDQLLPALTETRDSRQKDVENNTKAVAKCNSEHEARIKKIISGIKKTTDVKRKEHQACRKEEKEVHHEHKKRNCTALTTYLNEIEATSPEQPQNTDDDDAMVETVEWLEAMRKQVVWVEDMSDHWCKQGEVANEKEAACRKATKKHTDWKKKCDKIQDYFEVAFCTWRTELTDTCRAHKTCYDDAMKKYTAHKEETIELVEKWKVEFVALKKMSCYINVWLTAQANAFEKTSTATASKLEECKGLRPDESKMEVSFIPAPPAKNECSLEEVKNYPGTDGFKSTEYVEPLLDPAYVKEPTRCPSITEPETTTQAPVSPPTGGGY